MPQVGTTQTDKYGRKKVYTESSVTPGTFYWRTATQAKAGPTPEALSRGVETRKNVLEARGLPETMAIDSPTPAPSVASLPSPSGKQPPQDLLGMRNELMTQLGSPSSLLQAVKDRLAGARERNIAPLQEQRAGKAEELATLGTRSLGETKGFDIGAVRESENLQRQVLRAQLTDIDRRIENREKTIDENMRLLVSGTSEQAQIQAGVLDSLIAQQQQDLQNQMSLRQLDIQEEKFAQDKRKFELDRQSKLAEIQMSLPSSSTLADLGFEGAEGERRGLIDPMTAEEMSPLDWARMQKVMAETEQIRAGTGGVELSRTPMFEGTSGLTASTPTAKHIRNG